MQAVQLLARLGIEAEINAHLDKRNINDISAKRYALMDEYVRVSNSKTFGLFRDIIIPEEYDPMTAHGDFIKYDARERFDPCKLELRGAAAELGPAAVSGFAKAGGEGGANHFVECVQVATEVTCMVLHFDLALGPCPNMLT